MRKSAWSSDRIARVEAMYKENKELSAKSFFGNEANKLIEKKDGTTIDGEKAERWGRNRVENTEFDEDAALGAFVGELGNALGED